MDKYISIPLSEEQKEFLAPYLEKLQQYIGHVSNNYWIAGSFALYTLLGDMVEKPNDLDVFIHTQLNTPSLRDVVRRNLGKYSGVISTSKFAVTLRLPTNSEPIQLIPVSVDNLDAVLDAFDLTLAAVGIVLNEEDLFFKINIDVFNAFSGLPPIGALNPRVDNSLVCLLRALKYAEKFRLDVEEVFPLFAFTLKQIDDELYQYFLEDKGEFKNLLENLPDISSGNYDDNELLGHIIRMFDSQSRAFSINARRNTSTRVAEPVFLFIDDMPTVLNHNEGGIEI